MRQRSRAIPLLAAALLFLQGIAAESLHTDIVVAAGAGASLERHACEGHERHVPLDALHACAACAASVEGIAIPPAAGLAHAILPSVSCWREQPRRPFNFTDRSSPSRAPPGHS